MGQQGFWDVEQRYKKLEQKQDLLVQLYWLSEMHVGSTQTIRLPITTYYPDKGAEAALEGLITHRIADWWEATFLSVCLTCLIAAASRGNIRAIT